MREGWAGHLGLNDGPCQQPFAAHQIFAEELHNNVGDIGDVDFVDHSVDGLAQLLPHVLLVRLTCLTFLGHFGQQRPHFERWHVHSAHRGNHLPFRLDLHWLLDFFDCLGRRALLFVSSGLLGGRPRPLSPAFVLTLTSAMLVLLAPLISASALVSTSAVASVAIAAR